MFTYYSEVVKTAITALKKPPLYDDLKIEEPDIADVQKAIQLLMSG